MLEWLVPVGGFWLLGAAFIGTFSTAPGNGSPAAQLLGLLICYALFLGIWAALRALLGGLVDGIMGRVVLPTLVSIVLFPLTARAAFRVTGVRFEPMRYEEH